MAKAKKPEVKPYDDPNIHEDEIEPVLAVKQTRVIWILVAAVIWLSYQVGSIPDTIDRVVHKRLGEAAFQIQQLADIVDHELDDTNDNYEESLGLIIAGKCDEGAAIAYKNKCEARPSISEILQAGAGGHDAHGGQ